MLGVLLESGARAPRRSGGAALSVAAHLTIIAAIAANTVHGTPTKHEKPTVVHVQFARPTVRTPVTRPIAADASRRLSNVLSSVVIKRVQVPIIVPKGLPPIDFTAGASFDSIVISGNGGSPTATGRSVIEGESTSTSTDWHVSELLMHIIRSAKPRYPAVLRESGIDGRVLVRFVVDTSGRVDPASIRVVSSTHELFTRAVRDALGDFRFKPAEVGGRRVPALAEMPFEFRITNR